MMTIVSSPSTTASSIVSAPIQVEKPTAEVQAAYRSAYELVRDKSYASADKAFTDFVVKYPRNELTGNAYYWLGELFEKQRDYKTALVYIKKHNIVQSEFSAEKEFAEINKLERDFALEKMKTLQLRLSSEQELLIQKRRTWDTIYISLLVILFSTSFFILCLYRTKNKSY